MLKSLELFGFKSFADKTVFEFSSGITGVVGPNGSGKSNVVDAIKWILGDQSAKSLRGKDMTDVIFNGSSSRTGAQFAESTLVFDNSTRFLPIEQDEVSIGRRLWKTGDSEYLVNRTSARLKDVRDLFVGTGAGASAYCIIEQGRVDQILQSNAANRRLIFEEAAGISRFKARRNEAMRRLERVEQNLLRLTDIVDEVESQVSAIRGQAQKAARFRQLSAELESLWVGLAADEYRRQTMVRARMQQECDDASADLNDLRMRQEEADRHVKEADAAISVMDEQLRELESRRADLRSRSASLDTTLTHNAARDAELQSEMIRLTRQQFVMSERVVEADHEKAHLTQLLTLAESQLSERTQAQQDDDSRLQKLNITLSAAQKDTDELRESQRAVTQQHSLLSTDLVNLRSKLESTELLTHSLLSRKDEIAQQILQLQSQEQEARLQLTKVRDELRTAEDQADQLLSGRESLVSEQTEFRESLASLREQRSAAIARKAVLEDLEDRQEGFGIGVRDILRRAEDGSHAPWNDIRGSVADLLDVELENAALLEVALSGRAQLLVIDRVGPLVEYLNSGRCQITGRVGFVSLEEAHTDIRDRPDSLRDERHGPSASKQIVPQQEFVFEEFSSGMFGDDWLDADSDVGDAEEFVPSLNVTWVDENAEAVARSVFSSGETAVQNLTGQPGVVGRADRLARSPRHLPHLAAHLLADTWVVASLGDAMQLADKLGSSYRFVTLQGELVEKDGTLFTGMLRSESSVVSRKSELRRLKNELHRVEHQISERDLRLRKLLSSLESTVAELHAARSKVTDSTARVHSAEQAVEGIVLTRNAVEQQLRKLEEESVQNENAQNDLVGQQERIQQQLLQTETEAARLQHRIQEAEGHLAAEQQQIDELKRGRADSDLERTRTEERLNGIRDAVQRLNDDLEQRHLQQQEAERRFENGKRRVQSLLLSSLNVRGEISELRFAEESLSAEIQRHNRTRNGLRKRRTDATNQDQEVRAACRLREEAFHRLELKINAIDHQLESSAERIRDEYHIEVKQAAADGRSAIGIWLLREQEPPPSAETDDRSTADADDGPEFEAADSEPRLPEAFAAEATHPDLSAEVQAVLGDDERFREMRRVIEQRIDRVRKQLRKIGSVGSETLNNLNELETRFARLHSQLKDLEAAEDALRDMVRRINEQSRQMFVESFECIRTHFRDLFRRLFGGGEADVILEDSEDVLECAIDVVARPPGKELRSISLLSGGEKTMTAVALLLSIFRSRPSPFCILDEVDAALDDANIGRFVGVLKDFQDETQFIMITHRKPTMAVTDVLYGVTMEESGVSKRLSVRFEEIDERGNFVPGSQQSRAA